MVGGPVVLLSAFALGSFVYALLLVAQPGALDSEADSDAPDWKVLAKGGTAFGLAIAFMLTAILMIDV
ncbi:MAG: hypothetical protein AB7I38_10655 [Dehalococcoidia bacterium]